MQYYSISWLTTYDDDDNIIAALEHPDRVCRIHLGTGTTKSHLRKVVAVMQRPFPMLTNLSIVHDEDHEDEIDENGPPLIPTGFLGGSAPYLQEFRLYGIVFPALPTLLLSASDLVELRLQKIPLVGYISPKAMVAYLAVLPRLHTLQIEFQSVTSRRDQMLLPPQTRTVFPALSYLYLTDVGTCGYSKDFVEQIDTPLLDSILVYYSGQDTDFEIPQISEFIDRSENLKDTLSRHCRIMLCDDNPDEAGVDFYIGGAISHIADGVDNRERWDTDTGISLGTSGVREWVDRQMLQLTHALRWIYPILSDMVHLTIHCHFIERECLDDIEWLHLLRLFSSIQTLYVSSDIAGDISRTLNNIDGVLATEVLPALVFLCLEDQPLSSIDQFLAVRRDYGHLPIIRINMKKVFEEIRKVYL